ITRTHRGYHSRSLTREDASPRLADVSASPPVGGLLGDHDRRRVVFARLTSRSTRPAGGCDSPCPSREADRGSVMLGPHDTRTREDRMSLNRRAFLGAGLAAAVLPGLIAPRRAQAATYRKRLTGADLDTASRWHVAGTDLGIPY